MRFHKQILCIFALAASATAAFAQNPFIGDWKMNADKSHLTGDVLEFASAGGGAIKYSAEDRSYTFKTDGMEYTSETGAKHVWKMIDEHTYESMTTQNGIDVGKTVWKISADDKKLMTEDTGKTPSGKSFDDTATFTRVAGTKGLMGSWKNMEVKIKEDQMISLKAASTPDGIHYVLPDIKAYVDLSMDGKDCTPVGPTVPAGLTLSAKKTGPRSFSMSEKMNGKVLENINYKVSADGKTLTEVAAPPDGKAPATMIYDKQSM